LAVGRQAGEGALALERGQLPVGQRARLHLPWLPERIIGRLDVPATLLVTNDFPPRVGGIQRTLEALWKALPPERVSVLAPGGPETAAYDRSAPFPVLRESREFVWPTPRFAGRLERAVEECGAEVVLFGDAF